MFQINQYAIQDGKCFPVKPDEASALNEQRADVYWTPNNFLSFGKRKKEELTEITSFFCEIDDEDKPSQIKKIKNIGLVPSSVIETKRGFHVYWHLATPIDCRANPVMRADWFREILKNRICPALNADTQAADACRILRMPFYRYWKDGKGDFLIDVVFESDKKYSLKEILEAFPERVTRAEFLPTAPTQRVSQSGGFWNLANELPVLESLQKLSGSEHVRGEVYTFKNKKDHVRICANGKETNAWIDRSGKIGSTDQGGPSIPNWLFWYQRDWKRVAEILKGALNVPSL